MESSCRRRRRRRRRPAGKGFDSESSPPPPPPPQALPRGLHRVPPHPSADVRVPGRRGRPVPDGRREGDLQGGGVRESRRLPRGLGRGRGDRGVGGGKRRRQKQKGLFLLLLLPSSFLNGLVSPPSGEKSDIFRVVKMVVDRRYDPLIVFSFSRRDCETHAVALAALDLNSKAESEIVDAIFRAALDCLTEEDRKSLPQVSRVCSRPCAAASASTTRDCCRS